MKLIKNVFGIEFCLYQEIILKKLYEELNENTENCKNNKMCNVGGKDIWE